MISPVKTGVPYLLDMVPRPGRWRLREAPIRPLLDGLLTRGERDKLRVTIATPGFVSTHFVGPVTEPRVKARLAAVCDEFAIPPGAIARPNAFEQPSEVDVNGPWPAKMEAAARRAPEPSVSISQTILAPISHVDLELALHLKRAGCAPPVDCVCPPQIIELEPRCLANDRLGPTLIEANYMGVW